MENKGKGFFLTEQEKWLLDQLTEYPELQLCEGNFFQRLVSFLYSRGGDFRYPPELMILQFFAQWAQKKGAYPQLAHDVVFHVLQKPVYEIDCDGVIMAQDINRIVGPVQECFEESEEGESIEKTISLLEKFQPSRLGDILVSSPSWCKAKYLIEAVIYHFEVKRMTNQKLIRATLHAALKKAEKLKIVRLAMDALGTEYASLSAHTFARILCETLAQNIVDIKHLREIIVSARNPRHAYALKKAFIKLAGVE